MKSFRITLLSAMLMTVHSSVLAEAIVPLPSVLDFTEGKDGWGIALGASVGYEPAYDGSDEYEFEIEPAGAIQYRDGDHLVFWEGVELGWRSALNRRLFMQAGMRYESGLEPGDSDDGRLNGIATRDSHVAGFVEARFSSNGSWRHWVGGRIVGGEADFGVFGLIAAGKAMGNKSDGTGLEAFMFASFGNDAYLNKDFGVSASDAAGSGLTETNLPGGFRSSGFTVIYRSNDDDNIQLILEAGMEFYASAIKSSPVTREDYEAEISLAAVYRF